MKTRWFRIALVLAAFLPASVLAEARLVLTQDDIPRMKTYATGLKKAAAKGASQAKTFVAGQKTKEAEAKQQLRNIGIAYTALRLEEQIEELVALGVDKDPSSEYAQRVGETRKALDELTAEHRKAKAKDGRTALDSNKALVKANLPAVEQLMAEIRDVNAGSLPQ